MAADWLTIVLRFALYLDLAPTFGVAIFGLYALWHDERSSPIAQRYSAFIRIAAAIGLGLSLCGITVMAKAMAGVQSYGELSTQIFKMLITATHMGIAWCIRILALVVCVLISVLRFNPTWRFAAMAGTSAVALASLSWKGHGAMDDGIRGYAHLTVDIAHLYAAGAWVGALVAFLMLAMIKPADQTNAIAILSSAANSFARIGTLIVGVLTVSGIFNYILIVGPSIDPLVATLYGWFLLAKLALLGGMLALAAANRFRLSPSLKVALKAGNHAQAACKLRQSLFMEAFLAVLVFAVVAWLGVLSPR